MKRIRKSPPPNELTIYAAAHPNDEWDRDFRNHASPSQNPGDDYRSIKQRLVNDQGGLCAYCEAGIGNFSPDLQRVEHYHPKSDKSNPNINWHLLWSNVIAVCTGGEQIKDANFPKPENLSCDAHKNYYVLKKKLSDVELLAFLPALMNPLEMPALPALLTFDKFNCKLLPNSNECSVFDTLHGLAQGETEDKLTLTLEVLNLNCQRLCDSRRQVFIHYQQQVAIYRRKNEQNFRVFLANKWFGRNQHLPFFTTRRLLLGADAEQFLASRQFQG